MKSVPFDLKNAAFTDKVGFTTSIRGTSSYTAEATAVVFHYGTPIPISTVLLQQVSASNGQYHITETIKNP